MAVTETNKRPSYTVLSSDHKLRGHVVTDVDKQDGVKYSTMYAEVHVFGGHSLELQCRRFGTEEEAERELYVLVEMYNDAQFSFDHDGHFELLGQY